MKGRRWWLAALALIATLAAAFGIYVSDYYRATETALACLGGDDSVKISDEGDFIALDGPGDEVGLVFYPGGKVQAEAYLPLLKALARAGVDGYLARMPFNLAMFGVTRAEGIMARYDHGRWYLGGHSLGGAMAADWASKHADALEGLVLLGAYPHRPVPEGLRTLMLYGSEDGLVTQARVERAMPNLPADAVVLALPGGNHAQFGDYGEQKGDGVAAISRQEQQRRAVEEILKLMGEAPQITG